MSNSDAPLRDGLSPCGSNQQAVSPVPASIPSAKVFSGWVSDDLARVYHEIERIQATLPKFSTARACLFSALNAVELTDEYIAKEQREA